MALAVTFVISKNVKIKFEIEPHIEELATGNSKDFHLILVYLLPHKLL